MADLQVGYLVDLLHSHTHFAVSSHWLITYCRPSIKSAEGYPQCEPLFVYSLVDVCAHIAGGLLLVRKGNVPADVPLQIAVANRLILEDQATKFVW